jgi:hypothetical protein
MSATALSWADWYTAELAALRALIDDIPHPSGQATCGWWVCDLEAAARAGRHEEAARLGTRIRERAEQEHEWYRESLNTAV